jgi:hypothetical protein
MHRRYYSSIQVHSGGPLYALPPATTATAAVPAFFSPLLAAALILAGIYSAVTAFFGMRYNLTTYSESLGTRLKLLLLWPYLLVSSNSFRHQFMCAMRGEKVKLPRTADGAQQAPSASSATASATASSSRDE